MEDGSGPVHLITSAAQLEELRSRLNPRGCREKVASFFHAFREVKCAGLHLYHVPRQESQLVTTPYLIQGLAAALDRRADELAAALDGGARPALKLDAVPRCTLQAVWIIQVGHATT